MITMEYSDHHRVAIVVLASIINISFLGSPFTPFSRHRRTTNGGRSCQEKMMNLITLDNLGDISGLSTMSLFLTQCQILETTPAIVEICRTSPPISSYMVRKVNEAMIWKMNSPINPGTTPCKQRVYSFRWYILAILKHCVRMQLLCVISSDIS